METSDKLIDRDPHSPSEKLQKFYEEGNFDSEFSDFDEDNSHLQIEPNNKSAFKIFLTRALIVLGVILLFTLPLILFYFVKPIRSMFRIIAYKITFARREFVTYFVLWLIGTAFMLIGGPLIIFEMILGYSFQSFWTGYLLAIGYRLFGGLLTHLLSANFLSSRIEAYFDDSKHYHALQYLARKKPYQTLFLIRFSHIPTVILNYGIPILGYSLLENLSVAFIASLILSFVYVFFGVSAKSIEEIETLKLNDDSAWIQYFHIGITVISLALIIYLFFASKAKIEYIVKKYELEDLKGRIARREVSYGSLDFY